MSKKRGFFESLFEPDFNGDGEHDLLDSMIGYAIFNEIEKEEEEEKRKDSDTDFDLDSDDDLDLDSDDGLDLDSDDDLELFSDRTDIGTSFSSSARHSTFDSLDEDEYADEFDEVDDTDEFEDDLDDADAEYERINIPINFTFTLVPSQTAPEQEDLSTEDENTSQLTEQQKQAAEDIESHSKGEYIYTDEDSIEDHLARCHFILEDSSIAARYITVLGCGLFAQAIKEHFPLPFDIPDDTEYEQTDFHKLLGYLYEDDADKAFEIWDWTLTTFLPHKRYFHNIDALNYEVLLYLDCFEDDFIASTVEYMHTHPEFIEKVIAQSPDSLFNVNELLYLAMERDYMDTAKQIASAFLNNRTSQVDEIVAFVSNSIEDCINWDDKLMMERFYGEIFPLLGELTDKRIVNKLGRWREKIEDYIAKIDAQIVYERQVEERRVQAELRRREEARRAQTELRQKEEERRVQTELRQREEEQQAAEALADRTVYTVCQVSFNFPNKPFYSYLTDLESLKVGDRVTVPVAGGKEPHATVVAISQCYRLSAPYPIDKMRKVIGICEEE